MSWRASCDRKYPVGHRLTAAERHSLPASAFGLPGQRKYPMPDVVLARNAKARASAAYNQGYLSHADYMRIVNKANGILERCRAGESRRAAANPFFSPPALQYTAYGQRRNPYEKLTRSEEEFQCSACGFPLYVGDRAWLDKETGDYFCSKTCAEKEKNPFFSPPALQYTAYGQRRNPEPLPPGQALYDTSTGDIAWRAPNPHRPSQVEEIESDQAELWEPALSLSEANRGAFEQHRAPTWWIYDHQKELLGTIEAGSAQTAQKAAEKRWGKKNVWEVWASEMESYLGELRRRGMRYDFKLRKAIWDRKNPCYTDEWVQQHRERYGR